MNAPPKILSVSGCCGMRQLSQNKERNSSLELLRILCLIGIVCMHSLSYIWLDRRFMVLSVAENSLFNIGVTCFVLISGYFGVRFSIQRLLKVEVLALFGGIFTLVVLYMNGMNIGFNELLKNIFPIITRKYWFLTGYVCVVLLSPFLNRLVSWLSQKQFLKLLLVGIFLFYILPTFFYFQIVEDSGKGLVNMIVVYLLGRYLRLYPVSKSQKVWFGMEMLFLCLTIAANIAFILVTNRMELIFSRDNSVFILLQAVAVFHLFSNMQFFSKAINRMAGFVFPVYILNMIILEYFLPHNTAERLLQFD